MMYALGAVLKKHSNICCGIVWSWGESGEPFNEYLTSRNMAEHRVESYEDIFKIGNNRTPNMLKIRTVQAFIQIERRVGWSQIKIQKLAIELKQIELYN